MARVYQKAGRLPMTAKDERTGGTTKGTDGHRSGAKGLAINQATCPPGGDSAPRRSSSARDMMVVARSLNAKGRTMVRP